MSKLYRKVGRDVLSKLLFLFKNTLVCLSCDVCSKRVFNECGNRVLSVLKCIDVFFLHRRDSDLRRTKGLCR